MRTTWATTPPTWWSPASGRTVHTKLGVLKIVSKGRSHETIPEYDKYFYFDLEVENYSLFALKVFNLIGFESRLN